MDSIDSSDDLGAEVRGGVGRLYRRLRAERSDDTWSDTQLSVLVHLLRRGPQTLRELSDRERVSPPSMNQAVNALAAAGFVERTPDPGDGRRVLVGATGEGMRVASELRRRRNAWLDARLDALTVAERATMLEAARILRRIAEE
jgi:DNA-binding MarR family transcriptional regulator